MADMVKIDDTTVEIRESVEVVQKAVQTTLDALYKSKENYESKKVAIAADLDKKIAEIDALIAQALALGIKTDAEVVVEEAEVKP